MRVGFRRVLILTFVVLFMGCGRGGLFAGPEDSTVGGCAPGDDFRRRYFFDNTDQSGADLVDFPVAVRLDPLTFDYTRASPTGDDVFFLDDDSVTPLVYHVEHWDPAGESLLWVRVPHIPAGVGDDFIWMYYGDSEHVLAGVQDKAGTYDSSFAAVWHMDNAEDSTQNENHGTVAGTVSGAVGLYGSALDFTNGQIDVPASTSLEPPGGTDVFVEAWVHLDTFDSGNNDDPAVFAWEDGNTMMVGFSGGCDCIPRWRVAATAVETGTMPIGQWVHMAGTVSSSRGQTLFVDAVPVGTRAAPTTQFPPGPHVIGARPIFGSNINGRIDELRVSLVDRGPDWVAASRLNGQGLFLELGVDEATTAP